jgi:hypothetical protein
MSLEDKTIQDITHGLVAIRRDDKKNEIHVLNFCGFFEEPSVADYHSLRKELEEDPEFGLIGQDFEIIEATAEMIEHIKNTNS